MRLVDFQGLNCYQNSLVTISAHLGVDYKRAFENLWPETDFEYDDGHQVYLTRRMPENLASLGIRAEILLFDSEAEAREALSALDAGEPFLVCMDTFHIPWSPGFQLTHDPHYFAAQKEPPGLLACVDPTYNKRCKTSDEMAGFFSKLYRISRVAEKPLETGGCEEEIMRGHPGMQRRLCEAIVGCANENRRNTRLIAKYMDAMINNRYLYKYYLDHAPRSPAYHRQFMDKDFFSRWNAIKNGLYKSYIIKDNERVLKEVLELFTGVTDDEMRLAAGL